MVALGLESNAKADVPPGPGAFLQAEVVVLPGFSGEALGVRGFRWRGSNV